LKSNFPSKTQTSPVNPDKIISNLVNFNMRDVFFGLGDQNLSDTDSDVVDKSINNEFFKHIEKLKIAFNIIIHKID
jgi:hypothetical protein